ncbi:MAG: TIGR04283 family arsenosugar biosynthesis glycosyltransferase [Gammaproteobacteria bacterium]|nr:TIGR04283 family arsenosugar biosynthesis glycosyltransferase [Gammaproteobacteria bacterium]
MNPNAPSCRLSIVIPTLNEAGSVVRLLDDLAALRGAGHQLILVDGGSDDDTLSLAMGRVDQCLIGPAGRARQQNFGAAQADADILWFVHADSRVDPGAAQAIIGAIAGGALWGRFDVRLSGRRWQLRIVESLMNLRSRLTGIATGDQGIFVRRELFEQIGGFTDQPLMEDIDLSRRLRRQGRPCCLRRPRIQTSSRRWERNGIARTIWLMWRLRLAYALGTPAEQLARLYH